MKYKANSFRHAHDGSSYVYYSKNRTDNNDLISVTTPNTTSNIGRGIASTH